MASTYLTRTVGTPSSNQKFTISVWVKRTGVGDEDCICGSDAVGSQATQIYFKSDDTFRIFDSNSSTDLVTSRVFKDPNAYYHIVIAVDTSLGTASDRIKLYVNGVQETSFGTSNYSGQNNGWIMTSSGSKFYIGTAENTGGAKFGYMDGVLSHFHFVDNQQYNASVFGSTDSDTGEWKIKTSPTMTMGNMGFTVLKDGNTITDQSTNSNDFTLGGGTLTFTHDNPSNNFATFNSQVFAGGGTATFSNGNNTSQSPTSQGLAGVSSFGASSGKFYAEFKQSAESISGEGAIGVVDTHYINSTFGLSSSGYLEYCVGTWGFRNNSGLLFYSSGGTRYTATGQHANWSNGDIFMLALDADNGRLYIGKNGQWNASNTWSSSTPSQYITLDSTGFEGTYHFAVGDSSSGNHVTWQANFGNGYFGTTAITTNSGNGYAGAEGKSKFNYEVPSGYSALSTEGLNQ